MKISALVFCFLLTATLFSMSMVQVNLAEEPKEETVSLSPEFRRAFRHVTGI